MTGASFDFKALRKNSLPSTSQSIDVWLLRDQEVLLTKGSKHEDEVVNLLFSGFTASMHTNFAQDVTPTKQNFNQGLVLEEGLFKFVPMNTSSVYEVQNNADMSQVFRTFTQLIHQDKKFLNQLESFQKMLINSNVFQDPSTTPIPPNQVVKRSPTVFGGHLSNIIHNADFRLRFPRDIADIFTPYSVQSIGDTAGENYKKMNANFNKIGVTEQKLSHQQRTLAEHFVSLTQSEKEMRRKELYLELRAFRTAHFGNFMFDLSEILKHNRLDPVYDILFSLLRQHEFCHSSTCYTLPIFSILNSTSLQVSVQTAQQSLAPAVYISCTLQTNLRTSVFSHQIALVDDDTLNFQADQLPSVTFSQLVNPSIDENTRALMDTDMIASELYLIYSATKVSLQCVHPQMITVDGMKRYCDRTSLNFIEFPEEISIGTQKVLRVSIPHHFSSKLDFLNTDMRSVSLFKQTNSTDLHFGHQIRNFFQTATPIHYSFMFITFICFVLIFITACCFFYIRFPQCLLHAFCCFQNTCSLKQKVVKRSFEVQAIAAQNVNIAQRQESIVRNYQPIPQQRPTAVPSVEIPLLPMNNPSAPLIAQTSISTQPSTNPAFATPYICPNQVYGCFCADPTNPNPVQCLSALQTVRRNM